jgi:hypothetical protein
MNELMSVISIVPRLYPAIDGVGDYALNLARQLRKNFGIETHFIVCDPSWNGTTTIEKFRISQIVTCSSKTLASLLNDFHMNPTVVLLHYVGHGYARRGCPFWLVEGLEQWKYNGIYASIVTMFHELYASGGAIWRSNFWLSPLQRNLASRVSRLSDRCLTNSQGSSDKLQKMSLGRHNNVPAIPVFSNIGEPEQIYPLSERRRRIVVFGQKGTRHRVYLKSRESLNWACQILGIEEIWDIGSPIALDLAKIGQVPIIRVGQLADSEISEIMLNSVGGFFNYYDVDRLAKSGIFAAYCAHRLLPISDQFYPFAVDGIKFGENYWIPSLQQRFSNSIEELQPIASNAFNWYQQHRLSIQTKIFAELLVTHNTSSSRK